MKTRNSLMTASLCVLISVLPLLAAQPKEPNSGASQTFTGEIMDALCAKDGTHDKMMEEMKSMGRDKNTCAVKCAQLGAKYVLYDAAKKEIYGLDEQDKAEAFAGKRVRVTGTLQKNKIKIEGITGLD